MVDFSIAWALFYCENFFFSGSNQVSQGLNSKNIVTYSRAYLTGGRLGAHMSASCTQAMTCVTAYLLCTSL